MRLFIAGASGLVGGNCMRYFANQDNVEVVGTHFSFPTPETHYFDTLNLNNPDNFDIHRFKPTHILHAGALTYVDRCEEFPDESYRFTVESTLNMIQLANALDATMIYVSTDYVFDGKEGPYDETANVNPLSMYARHKLDSEELIQKELKKWLILRITNVYGHEIRNKNFIARLIKAGIDKEPLTLKLPNDQYATPVNAHDVAKAMWVLLSTGKEGLYHIAGTDYLNRVQLANKVLGYFPMNKAEVLPCSTQELNQPALRPLQGGLKSCKFLDEFPDFQFSSVDNFLASIIEAI